MKDAERAHRNRWPLAITIVTGVVSFVVLWPIQLMILWPRIPRWAIAPRTLARGDVAFMVTMLEESATKNDGTYPTSLRSFVAPDGNGISYIEGYTGKPPLDPWGHEYQYERPTPEHPKPHVWSYGADGKRGGTGDDADIDSDELPGGSR